MNRKKTLERDKSDAYIERMKTKQRKVKRKRIKRKFSEDRKEMDASRCDDR